MSGGGFNHFDEIYEFHELVARLHDLREITAELETMPGTQDAALQAQRLINLMDKWTIIGMIMYEDLREVFKAVERRVSSDWDDDQVQAALAKWREAGPKS